MKVSDLKLSVEQIQIEEEMQQQMIKELAGKYGTTQEKSIGRQRKQQHKKTISCYHFGKAAAVFVIVVVALAGLSIPVRALVNSIVQERMEELPREEVASIVEQTDNQETEADSFSREYTEGEKERRAELYKAYMEGTFPQGELMQVDSEEEARQQEFCFLTTSGTFFLPANRELTDEEILQMIDFEKKRDYALLERYEEEYAEEIAAEQAEEKEQIANLVSEGGITEQEAIEIATRYLQQVYGLDGSGMELNHYYNENGWTGNIPEDSENANYCVNWSDHGSYQHYYFWIDAGSGELLEFDYSGSGFMDLLEETPSVSEASVKASSAQKQAVDFLENKMGITESYDKIETCYRVYNGEELGSFVYNVFHKSDQTVYVVTCCWDGTIESYISTTAKRWEEHIEQETKLKEKSFSEQRGEDVTIELIRQ